MFDTLQPLYDRVLVERTENEQKTASGIIIPDAAQEKGQVGRVKAVGPGKLTPEGKFIPLTVKVGDTVFFGKYSGTEAGKNYLVLKEDELLGIIR